MNEVNNSGEADGVGDAGRPDEPVDSKRRRLCQVVIGGTAAISVGALGYPVVTFLRLPKSLGPVELMEVPLEELAEGYGYWGEHRGRQIVVIKLGEEIRAFDGTCTHLGCIVQWDSTSRGFWCPCHNGRFDNLGNPVSGPVNVPLRRMEYVVEENVLKIRDSSARA